MILKFWFSVIFLSLVLGCRPPDYGLVQDVTSYPQDFKSHVAFLALEFNRKPYIMASGYLADKEKGIFYTAKHFTDGVGTLGPEYCRVFFNGQIFKAIVVRVPPTRDAALIKILPPFLPADFPEPLKIAANRPKFGEKIFIQGFHPHAYWIRKKNEEEGFPDKVVPILGSFYGQVMRDLNRETQVVYHNLEGTVTKPNPNPLVAALKEFENDSYIKVVMSRDHKFSFGGLSGGLAVNNKNEVIGVITAQDIFRFEFDENGFFIDPHSGQHVAEIKKQLFDTIYITPIDAILDLEEYIKALE